jgi:hypothetical protein
MPVADEMHSTAISLADLALFGALVCAPRR